MPRWLIQFAIAAWAVGFTFATLAVVWPDGWWRGGYGISGPALTLALIAGAAWALFDYIWQKRAGR